MTWHVIILIAMALVVRLVKPVYGLCNFNNLQMPDKDVKQNCCPNKIFGNE